MLYSQGEPADAMYYLQQGQIQITVVSSQGKEGILGVLEPGGFCGEGCLLGNRSRVATVACIADSVVARLEARQRPSRHSGRSGDCRLFLTLCFDGGRLICGKT